MESTPPSPEPILRLERVSKTFTLHMQGGLKLPVVRDVSFDVCAGECVVLDGPSGAGKSSILKMIHGNYLVGSGSILLREEGGWVDMARAPPRRILELRQRAIGYVSQFLRVIPRVSCLELVAARACESGCGRSEGEERAAKLLTQLNVPERLWKLAPATFSGGEQQRVNIACGFAARRPLMLLDEPTASLDRRNCDAVIMLIEACKAQGSAVLGIFHDAQVRARVADKLVDMRQFAAGTPIDV